MDYSVSGSAATDVTPGRPKVLARLSAGQRKVLTVLADREMEPEKPLDANLLGALQAISSAAYSGEDDELVRTALTKQGMTAQRRGAYDDGMEQLMREQQS